MNEYRYAGYFAIDMRLTIFLMLISCFLTIGIIALLMKERRWHEYVSAFITIFTVLFVLAVILCNYFLKYPVFTIEAFFPFP